MREPLANELTEKGGRGKQIAPRTQIVVPLSFVLERNLQALSKCGNR